MTAASELPRLSPAEVGLSSRAVLDLLDDVEASGLELHSLMILRSGGVAVEGWWTPYRPELRHLLYSLSKSFVSSAVGLLVSDGRLNLDERLVDVLSRWVPDVVPARVADMTVRHALTMSTGHTVDPIFPMLVWSTENRGQDWLTGFFGLEPGAEPGSIFTYDQLATYVLSRIVTERTGERVVDFLRPRLFEPLGIDAPMWLTDGQGHDWGFSGLHLRTADVARFGQMLLRNGEWDGRQVLPAGWVAEATRFQVANDRERRAAHDLETNPDWLSGYGYQFWMCRHGFRGDGAHGQFCVVWPEEDVVIATTAALEDMQGLLDRIESHLMAGIGEPTATEDGRLAERLDSLALPTVPHDEGGPFGPLSVVNDGNGQARRLRAVDVEESPDGWRIGLDLSLGNGGSTRGELSAGRGRWVEGTWPSEPAMPVAICGGRIGEVLRLDVAFVQTPHRLVLDVDPAAGTFNASWPAFPLHGSDPADFAVV